jgi:hypothetical protein
MIRSIDFLNSSTQNRLKLSQKRNKVFHFFQRFSPELWFYSDPDYIDTISIETNEKNHEYINNVIDRAFQLNPKYISNYDNNFGDSTKCVVIYNQQKYPGHLKLQGQDASNYRYEKKAYAIKLEKGTRLPFEKIALINLEDHSIPNLFSDWLSDKYLDFSVEPHFTRLIMDGKNYGLYYQENKPSKQTLKNNGFPNASIIKPLDEWKHQYNYSPHSTPFTYLESNTRLKNYSNCHDSVIKTYCKLMTAATYDQIKTNFEIDYLAKYEALRFLTMDYHDIEGDNLKMIYDTDANRFFPYFRMEHFFIDLTANSEAQIYAQGLCMRKLNNNIVSRNHLFSTINQNASFRLKRNQYLFQLWRNKDKLLITYDSLTNKLLIPICIDASNRLPYRVMKTYLEDNRKVLESNLNKIGRYLNYNIVYCTINLQPNYIQIDVTPDANTDIRFKSLNLGLEKIQRMKIKIDNGESFDLYSNQIDSILALQSMTLELNNNLEIKPRTYSFYIQSELPIDSKRMKLEFINNTTRKLVNERDVYIQEFGN